MTENTTRRFTIKQLCGVIKNKLEKQIPIHKILCHVLKQNSVLMTEKEHVIGFVTGETTIQQLVANLRTTAPQLSDNEIYDLLYWLTTLQIKYQITSAVMERCAVKFTRQNHFAQKLQEINTSLVTENTRLSALVGAEPTFPPPIDTIEITIIPNTPLSQEHLNEIERSVKDIIVLESLCIPESTDKKKRFNEKKINLLKRECNIYYRKKFKDVSKRVRFK